MLEFHTSKIRTRASEEPTMNSLWVSHCPCLDGNHSVPPSIFIALKGGHLLEHWSAFSLRKQKSIMGAGLIFQRMHSIHAANVQLNSQLSIWIFRITSQREMQEFRGTEEISTMHWVKLGRIQCLIHSGTSEISALTQKWKKRIGVTAGNTNKSGNQQCLLKTSRENRVASEMQNNQYLLLVINFHFPSFTLLIAHLSFHAIKSRGL